MGGRRLCLTGLDRVEGLASCLLWNQGNFSLSQAAVTEGTKNEKYDKNMVVEITIQSKGQHSPDLHNEEMIYLVMFGDI